MGALSVLLGECRGEADMSKKGRWRGSIEKIRQQYREEQKR
jgi:hypothetical protein